MLLYIIGVTSKPEDIINSAPPLFEVQDVESDGGQSHHRTVDGELDTVNCVCLHFCCRTEGWAVCWAQLIPITAGWWEPF